MIFGKFYFCFTLIEIIKFVKCFNYGSHDIIKDIIDKTFSNYNKCLNLYINNQTYDNYNFEIVEQMHNTSYSLSYFSPISGRPNEQCGYIFFCQNFNEISLLLNLKFNRVPRILYFVEENEDDIMDLYKNQFKIFGDKDFVIADFSSKRKVTVYQQSRFSLKLKVHNISLPESIFLPEYYNIRNMKYEPRTVNVVTFNCPVFNAIQFEGEKEVLGDGVETRIFKEIAKKLNFKWNIIVPKDGKRWGSVFSNKTIDGGILKILNTGEADIGFCSLWVEHSKYSAIAMSYYWEFLCLKFLVPKPIIISSNWGNIFRPLRIRLWIMISFSVIITSIVNFLIQRIHQTFTSNCKEGITLISSFTTTVGILVMAKHLVNYRGNDPSRHLFLWWSIFGLVITTAYSSSLISHLAYPEFSPMIDTIEEITKAGYYWGTPYDPPIKYLFKNNDEDKSSQEFARRFIYETKTDNRTVRLRRGNYTAFVKCIDRTHFMEVQDVPNNILRDLRATRNCFNYFLLSFGFRKDFPYIEEANRIIATLVESGITKYWLDRLFQTEYVSTTFAKVYEYKTPPEEMALHSLTLANLQSIFYIFIIGLILSTIIFFTEILRSL